MRGLFMMKKLNFALLCLIMSMSQAIAQGVKVTGYVMSTEDDEPVIGASIFVKGTTIGTVSNLDGNFFLEVPQEKETLVISYMGMVTQEVKVTSHITVRLKPDALNLDEVVITGYGITKKAAFTGAAQVVNGESLVKKTDANFMKSLEGSVAGLQVGSFTGQPGAFSSTTIRGKGSVNSGTEPLFVIDGIAIYTDKLGSYSQAGSGEMAASPLANINPSDIESVTVLKDATATAIYGARAANGVVVISTKRGNKGAPRFNFSAKTGTSFPGKLDHKYTLVDLEKYKTIWKEGLINSGYAESQEDSEALLNSLVLGNYDVDLTKNIESTDWMKAILKNGFTQEYNLDVQGGTDAVRYFISGNYFQNEGIMIGTGMKRYSGRFNLDGNSGRLGYGLSVNAAYSSIDNGRAESQYTNPVVAVYDLRPFQSIYNADGTYNLKANYNPVAVRDKEKGDKNRQNQMTLMANPYFTYRFMDGLTWKTNAGLSLLDMDEFIYCSVYNPLYSASGMLAEQGMERVTTLSVTNTINFVRSFSELHNINLMAGQEAQKIQYRRVYTAAGGFPNDSMTELGNASTPLAASSMRKASTLASFFFNGEYNYNNKYYASASFRYDGSSRFGANNKWAPFWSVGAKYRISEEVFMERTRDWLSDLTIRASYGTVGNQDIGYFAAMGLYYYGYPYNSKPGAVPVQAANPDLKWETVAKADFGISGVLFDRFSFELDYYNQRTRDMLFQIPLSYVTGYNSIMKNVGTMQNQGIEFLINAAIITNKDFGWSINLAGTANRNKITKLATDYPIEETLTIRKVGEAYHTFYLPEYVGVDPETGSPLWYKGKEGNETTSNVKEAGQRIVGSADPKFYGGFGMNFRYRNFDFSFDASYSLGNKVYNRGFSFDMQVGHYLLGPISNYVYDNRWQKPGDITQVPKFEAMSASGADTASSRFLMNGSYLRMKSIVLGYKLPKCVLRALTASNLRVYASFDNLFTITAKDYIGFDPQTHANGMQSWAYPVPKTVMFGLNLGF